MDRHVVPPVTIIAVAAAAFCLYNGILITVCFLAVLSGSTDSRSVDAPKIPTAALSSETSTSHGTVCALCDCGSCDRLVCFAYSAKRTATSANAGFAAYGADAYCGINR